MTLAGEAPVSLPTWVCHAHTPPYRFTPPILGALTLPHRQVGMDVLLAVGVLRYGLHRQREEVKLLLNNRGLHLSSGEISGLADEFLIRWRRLCQTRSPHLPPHLDDAVLCVDGTSDQGGRVTFRAVDASRHHLTLRAECLSSEIEGEVTRFLEALRVSCPRPLAVVRDMSQAIANAVTRIFPDAPQQICHYHFLRAVGEHVLAPAHETLKRRTLATHQLARLLDLRRTLLTPTTSNEGSLRDHLVLWTRLLIEHIEHPRTQRGELPFQLPYLAVAQRARDALPLIERAIRIAQENNTCSPALLETKERIHKLLAGPGVQEALLHAQRLHSWFHEIRELMRLERAKHDSRMLPPPLTPVDKSLILARVHAIHQEARQAGQQAAHAWEGVVARFQAHEHELWACANIPGSPRVNNGLEGKHRALRQDVRRRTGKQDTRREMERTGELTAYWANATNPWFVEHVLQGIDIRAAFLAQDETEIARDLQALRRKRWSDRLPVRPEVRPTLLEGFLPEFRTVLGTR